MLDRKYKLVRLLGQGGMGSVYEAEHEETHQRVAVKLIQASQISASGEAVRRFRREARAAGSASSEHIVQVLEAGEDQVTGQVYLVMEYLEGEDLQQIIDRLGPITPDTVLRIAAQALSGLQKAHEAQVVHRDIKPANLFLARGEGGAITLKLLDFGIAKIKVDPLQVSLSTGLTNSGEFLGSPMYMSPEQVMSSRDVDHRADLWSLASALYCALAGHPPYAHVSPVGRLLYTICSAPPPPLRDAAPWVPAEIAEVVHGALRLDPAARYPSAAAMLEALRPLLSGGTALEEAMIAAVSAAEREAAARRRRDLWLDRLRAEETTSSHGSALADVPGRISPPATGAGPGQAGPEEYAATVALAGRARAPSTPRPDGPKPEPAVPSVAEPAPARSMARRAAVGVTTAVLALYLGFEAASWITGGDPEATGSPREILLPLPSVTPIVPEPRPPEPRRVPLVVIPGDAQVEIGGVLVPASDGVVELEGALGSVHHVRVRKGTSSVEADVMVTDQGAQPPKLELLSPTATPPPPRPRPRAPGPPADAGPTPHAQPPAQAEPAPPAPPDAVERTAE